MNDDPMIFITAAQQLQRPIMTGSPAKIRLVTRCQEPATVPLLDKESDNGERNDSSQVKSVAELWENQSVVIKVAVHERALRSEDCSFLVFHLASSLHPADPANKPAIHYWHRCRTKILAVSSSHDKSQAL